MLILSIIFVLFVITSLYLMYRSEFGEACYYAYKGRTNSEQVDFIFNDVWNGEEVSREAAWQRTIERLKASHYPDEMIIEAQLRLLFLQRGKNRSEYSINKSGRLIHVTQLGGVQDE